MPLQEQRKDDFVNDEGYWQALLEQGKYAPPFSWVLAQHNQQKNNDPSEKHDSMSEPLPTAASASEPLPDGGWQALQEIYRDNRIVTLPITGANRGGLLTTFYDIQGFVPISHLANFPYFNDSNALQRALEAFIGQQLPLRIVELDPSRERLILSAKAALHSPKENTLWQRIRPGDIVEGPVSAIRSFGAFVDLDGIEGLIHISELSWTRISRPEEVVQIGQPLRVKVLEVDPRRQRIALSLKELLPDPWQEIEKKYHVGQDIFVTITNVLDFGAFAEVENGVEGLIHISELKQDAGTTSPLRVVRPGDRVKARIVQIDSHNHRIALSLRSSLHDAQPGSIMDQRENLGMLQ